MPKFSKRVHTKQKKKIHKMGGSGPERRFVKCTRHLLAHSPKQHRVLAGLLPVKPEIYKPSYRDKPPQVPYDSRQQ